MGYKKSNRRGGKKAGFGGKPFDWHSLQRKRRDKLFTKAEKTPNTPVPSPWPGIAGDRRK